MTTRGWWRRQKAKPGGVLAAIWRNRNDAAKTLRIARSRAADDGMFPMRETAVSLAAAELRGAERRFQAADAEWRAAGCPDKNGRRARRGGEGDAE